MATDVILSFNLREFGYRWAGKRHENPMLMWLEANVDRDDWVFDYDGNRAIFRHYDDAVSFKIMWC